MTDMDNYERFKKIMAEIDCLKQLDNIKNNTDLPPGFEEIFGKLNH